VLRPVADSTTKNKHRRTTSFGLGVAGIVFCFCDTLASALVVMVIFSSLVNAAEGAIFGVAPCINPAHAGSMAGIVGMGGNLGGILFAIGFYYLSYRNAFLVMGVVGLASSAVYGAVHIPGHSRLWSRKGAFFESDGSAVEITSNAEVSSPSGDNNNETHGRTTEDAEADPINIDAASLITVEESIAAAPKSALPVIDEGSPA